MISIQRLIKGAAAVFALAVFSTAVLAQDTAPKTGADRVEKKERVERRARTEGMRAMRGFHGRHGGGGMIRGLHRLDLTDAQKSQIETLVQTHKTTNKPVMEEMHSLMTKRREGTFTDADKARVEELRSGMKASGDQLRATILGLLTPEQTQKLEQMKLERQERMELRKERMLERREKMEQRLREKKEAKPADQ
ncbi:MAG: Spy/CpxP family protein refolding chaperone [Acidobacteriota bacterium]|nr:MAG: Spy/CpxP family protein refolding chaperone [Acidobacteriota bacterium]